MTQQTGEKPLSVLSLVSVYPRPGEETTGLFVRARLQALAENARVRVVAPVGWIEYGNARRKIPGRVPARRRDGALEVMHPRWAYAPGRSDWNPRLLAGQVASLMLAELAKERADVIDAHFGHPEGVAAMLLSRRTGVPFAVTLRGSEVRHALNVRKRESMKEMFREAARVIGVSGRLREFAVEMGADAAKTLTIPNGIDPRVFHAQDRAQCRAELGMAEGRRYIVSAGHLIELKGHHRAIEAMKTLGPETELWIAGGAGRDRSYEQEIRAAAEDGALRGRVRLLGAVEQHKLAKLLSAADMFCLASSREGWPNVVHEALACGTPVVATDAGGVRELVAGDEYGVVVPVDDAAALADGLRRALGRDWDRAAIAELGGRRSWAAVACEVEDVLSAAAGR